MPLYFGGALILGAFVWFFCAYLCYVTAGQRHRRPLTWGILGIIFGPFALAAVYLMAPGHLAPSASGGGSAGHGSSEPEHDHAHEAGSNHDHEHQAKTQADLYEVPHKHKH